MIVAAQIGPMHPGEYLETLMVDRGWSVEYTAFRVGAGESVAAAIDAVEILLTERRPALILGAFAARLDRAFGLEEGTFARKEAAWRRAYGHPLPVSQ